MVDESVGEAEHAEVRRAPLDGRARRRLQHRGAEAARALVILQREEVPVAPQVPREERLVERLREPRVDDPDLDAAGGEAVVAGDPP